MSNFGIKEAIPLATLPTPMVAGRYHREE